MTRESLRTHALLRSYWHSLGRAGVVSVPGFLLFALLIAVRALLTQLGDGTPLLGQTVLAPTSPGVARVVAATLATIAGCGLVMLIADRTVLRRRPVDPWVTFCVYAAIVIVMSSMRALGNQRPVFDGAEFVARIALGMLWIIIISIALDARSEQLAALAQLKARRQRLESLRVRSERALVDLRRRLGALVEDQVTPAVRSTIADLARLRDRVRSGHDVSSQLPLLAQHIREFGDNTVRDLSHQLDQPTHESFDDRPLVAGAAVDAIDAIDDVAVADKPSRFRSLVRDTTLIQPLSPFLTSVTLLLTSLPTLIVAFGSVRGSALSFVGCASAYVCLKIADYVVTPRLRARGSGLRLAVVLGVYVATGVVVYASHWLLLEPALPLRFLAVFIFGLVVVGGAWAVAGAISEQRRRVRLDLAAAVAAVDWQTTATNNRLHAIRQATARLLHGDIQSRLAAVAMRLNFAVEQSNSAALNGAINDSLTALDSVLESLERVADAAPEPTDVVAALKAIAASWNNAMTVTFTIDADVVRKVEQSSLAAAVVDIAREATVNAARHGSARHVDVTITAELDSVRLVAIDDGSGPDSILSSGLGLGSLARLGATWELTPHDPTGTRLTVDLPAQS